LRRGLRCGLWLIFVCSPDHACGASFTTPVAAIRLTKIGYLAGRDRLSLRTALSSALPTRAAATQPETRSID
jgi:hypothetical protein